MRLSTCGRYREGEGSQVRVVTDGCKKYQVHMVQRAEGARDGNGEDPAVPARGLYGCAYRRPMA